MAQFEGTVEGSRGKVSRLGTYKSGLRTTANGWGIGVTVDLLHVDGKNVVVIYLTGGLEDKTDGRILGRFVEGEPVFPDGYPKGYK